MVLKEMTPRLIITLHNNWHSNLSKCALVLKRLKWGIRSWFSGKSLGSAISFMWIPSTHLCKTAQEATTAPNEALLYSAKQLMRNCDKWMIQIVLFLKPFSHKALFQLSLSIARFDMLTGVKAPMIVRLVDWPLYLLSHSCSTGCKHLQYLKLSFYNKQSKAREMQLNVTIMFFKFHVLCCSSWFDWSNQSCTQPTRCLWVATWSAIVEQKAVQLSQKGNIMPPMMPLCK